MSETLCSVGLDVGTTSTQMILSELTVKNQASEFAVPEMVITERKILYRSPIHFTPLLDEHHVDGEKIRELIAREYDAAGIHRNSVDTGAIIITGETARKENAGTVLTALSDFAGEFVVATAGPALESELAAKGSGAAGLSRKTGKRILHFDIGGGTSNLALLEDGEILNTCCLNVGGRLIKTDPNGKIIYLSPVIRSLTGLQIGQTLSAAETESLTGQLVQILEMAAGLRPRSPLLESFQTIGSDPVDPEQNRTAEILSFSGGVADCIDTVYKPDKFGDIGPSLGQAIRSSLLCQKDYVLGSETIRATVIGAGCHSAQLSGSTVFVRNTELPLKNLRVVKLSGEEQELPGAQLSQRIREKMQHADTLPVLALPGIHSPGYAQVAALADAISAGFGDAPVLIVLEQDMAKALGQALALKRGPTDSILCLDRIRLENGSYLDVGANIGPALPVVIKTLILNG